MGIPYLETGESIILTTGRVSINSVVYDVLLTTRNLILVDNRYGDFQPRIFPLFIIQSVKGGKTTSGELAITIFFADTSGTGEPEPMVLIFSQLPRENRKRERDDWLKKLMELIISVHQKTVENGMPSPAHEIGIRPSMRRPVAPDIPLPYTSIIETPVAPINLTMIDDEPESLMDSGEREAVPENAFSEEDEKPETASALCEEGEIPGAPGEVTGSPETIPALHYGNEDTNGTQDLVPESPDIQMYDTVNAGNTDEPEPESPDTISFTDSLSSVDEPDVSVTTEPSLPFPKKTNADLYDVPKLPPEAKAAESTSARNEYAEALSILKDARIAQTGATGTEDTESLDLPAAQESVIIESASVPICDIQQTEVVQQESEEVRKADREPSADAAQQLPEPPLPSLIPGDRQPSFITIMAIILIFLGIAGAAIVFSQDNQSTGIQPAPVPTPGSNQMPSPRPTLQQLPVSAQVVIPQTGVWVRVLYSRNYSGWVGIPGNLKEVSGSSDRFFKIFDGDGIAQVKINKEDNSGDTLKVEVYREGTIIYSRMILKPMGSIEFMIDTRTGLPPGITPVATQLNNQSGSSGKIMYF